MDIHLFDLITPGLINKTLDLILSFNKDRNEQVNLFIGNTRTEKTIFAETIAAANDFYVTANQFDNLCTTAGPDIEQIGLILFLSGSNRRLIPSASFKIPWNKNISDMLMRESGKNQHEILSILNNKDTMNAFQAMQLGISSGYYAGPISRDHRQVMARVARAPQ